MRGDAFLFFAIVALYAFALSGLGLVLATIARSSAQVGLLVILTVLPMLFLSGTASRIECMPAALR
jgi:ABC-2 type transport system permease protein